MPPQTRRSLDLSLEPLCLMSFCRCFMFGIGQNACRRLVQGLATVSKGTAEFLADGERLQPKVSLAQLFLLKTGFFWPPESRSVVIYRHREFINLSRNSHLRDARGSVYRSGRKYDLHLKVCFLILTTQMIKSLKKTMSPVLSDISIEWLFPETKEVLLSPVGNTFLFPGDSLISYAVVCDTTRYHANPKSVSAKCTHYCMRHVCIILDMASCVGFIPNFFFI